jgi:alpha-tubulin suppressor-like RCC1 family protein
MAGRLYQGAGEGRLLINRAEEPMIMLPIPLLSRGTDDYSILASSTPIQEVTWASDWAGVSAGWYHTGAAKRDGWLFCWGENEYGQLGNGDNTVAASATPIQEVTPSADWAHVSAGESHTCEVKIAGRLLCWGDNSYGQRGRPSSGPVWPVFEGP